MASPPFNTGLLRGSKVPRHLAQLITTFYHKAAQITISVKTAAGHKKVVVAHNKQSRSAARPGQLINFNKGVVAYVRFGAF
jgi:hypothetical protein